MIRSAIFFIVFYVFSFFYAIFIIIFGRHSPHEHAKHWACLSLKLLEKICKIQIQYKGTIPPAGSIIAPQHRSNLETIALLAKLDKPTFVFTHHLLYIPILGSCLKILKMIPVNRYSKKYNKNWLNLAQNALNEGNSIVIFPEGIRVKPGSEVSYKPGVFKLANLTNQKIVPVAVNVELFWPLTGFMKIPGTALIIFGEPITPDALQLKKEYNKLKLNND